MSSSSTSRVHSVFSWSPAALSKLRLAGIATELFSNGSRGITYLGNGAMEVLPRHLEVPAPISDFKVIVQLYVAALLAAISKLVRHRLLTL